jgi:hypothetical protein
MATRNKLTENFPHYWHSAVAYTHTLKGASCYSELTVDRICIKHTGDWVYLNFLNDCSQALTDFNAAV